MYILTFVPLQMQWKKSVSISSHRAKGIAIMIGPLQQVCVLAGDAQSRMEFMHGALLDIGE